MSAAPANSTLPTVRTDWLAGSRLAIRESEPTDPFELVLQPPEARQSQPCNDGECRVSPEKSPETDDGNQDEARGPQASAAKTVDNDSQENEDSTTDEAATEAQSLSGASAAPPPPLEDANLVGEVAVDVPLGEAATTEIIANAEVVSAVELASAERGPLNSGETQQATVEFGSELAASAGGDLQAASGDGSGMESLAVPTEKTDAWEETSDVHADGDSSFRERGQRFDRSLRTDSLPSLPAELQAHTAAAGEVQPAIQTLPAADQSGPSHAAPAVPALGAAMAESSPSRLLAGAASAEPVNAGTGPNLEIDSARLMQRVARAFAQAADRQGEVTIRLTPPELGALRLEVRLHEGALAARMQAETPEAQAAILDNLSILRERLADQGVRIERFDVDLMNRQSGGAPHQSPHEQRESPPALRNPTASRASSLPPTNVIPTTSSLADSGRLNVIV